MGTGDWWLNVSNIVYVVGTVTTLAYFFFTVEKKGTQLYISKIGQYTMMVALVQLFGNTVIARVSLFLGRVRVSTGSGSTTIRIQI